MVKVHLVQGVNGHMRPRFQLHVNGITGVGFLPAMHSYLFYTCLSSVSN